MSAKRNDPCHCGSGKKFKKCCMQSPADSVSAEDLLTCVDSLLERLERFALRRFGDLVGTAGWQDFSRWGIAAIAHEKETYQQAFTAWWLFAWLPDDQDLNGEHFLIPAPDHAIAADYLTMHRTDLSPHEQQVIEQALTSPHSFYSLLSIESGNRLRVQEVYTRKKILVDGSANASYVAGDVLFGTVLSVGGRSILLGCMPHALSAHSLTKIERHREKWCAEVGQPIDQRLLYLHDTELRRYYFILLNQQQQQNLH